MANHNDCILLKIFQYTDRGYYEAWWLVLGFFLGLILGMVLGFICLRMCINSFFKKRRQDEEQKIQYSKLEERKKDKELKKKFGIDKKSIRKSLKKRLKSSKRGSKRGDGDGSEGSAYMGETVLTALEADDLETVQAGDGVDGMIDAVVQTTEEAGENELLKKDVASTMIEEQNIRQNRIIALAELCRLYLNKLVQAGRVDEASFEGLVEFIHNGAHDLKEKAEAELNVLEEEIRSDPQLQKDKALMDKKLDELPSKQNSVLSALLAQEQMRMARRLAKDANLSEEEADALLSSLAADMSLWEQTLADQQAKNTNKLEDRLARRRQLAALAQARRQEARDDVEGQLVTKEAQLQWLSENAAHKLSDKQRQEILDRYREDLLRFHEAHEQNILNQQQKMNEKLSQYRENRLKDLSKKQLLKEQEFLRRVNQVTETEDFVKAFGALLEQQTDERESLIAEIDQQECQALLDIRKNLDHERQSQINEMEDDFLHRLKSSGSVSTDEVDHLISIHESEVNEFKRIKKMERRMQNSKLAERLAERRQQFEEDQKRSQIEDKALRDQQTTTLKKTLNLQMELPDDAKDRIMKDHEQNVTSLTNQLTLSRNRQRKQTEQRLAERRAKVAALRLQKEDERLARRGERAKELERVEKEIDAKIAAAEKEVNDAKVREMEEMRERLASETEEALKAQEEQMSAIIARMQVGQARRQNIINKQDKMIAELEAKLEGKLANSEHLQEGDPAMHGLDQLLQTHFNQVANLSEQLQDDRQRQESILADKLRKKRMKKEQALEKEIDTESGQTIDRMERAGVTRVGQMLMESAMDSKHKAAMTDLEKEMMVEFQREKEEMNRQLERELEEALEEQQKSLLAQLASVAALDEQEVNQVASAAAKESGVRGRDAKRFAREFTDSFRRRSSSVYGDDVQYGETYGKDGLNPGDSKRSGRSKRSKKKKNRDPDPQDDMDTELAKDFY